MCHFTLQIVVKVFGLGLSFFKHKLEVIFSLLSQNDFHSELCIYIFSISSYCQPHFQVYLLSSIGFLTSTDAIGTGYQILAGFYWNNLRNLADSQSSGMPHSKKYILLFQLVFKTHFSKVMNPGRNGHLRTVRLGGVEASITIVYILQNVSIRSIRIFFRMYLKYLLGLSHLLLCFHDHWV